MKPFSSQRHDCTNLLDSRSFKSAVTWPCRSSNVLSLLSLKEITFLFIAKDPGLKYDSSFLIITNILF